MQELTFAGPLGRAVNGVSGVCLELVGRLSGVYLVFIWGLSGVWLVPGWLLVGVWQRICGGALYSGERAQALTIGEDHLAAIGLDETIALEL